MEINKINQLPLLHGNQERNKFVCLFNWLDTKSDISEVKLEGHRITKCELQKYVITIFFDYRYYENINFVKKIFYIFNKRTR